MMLHVIGYTAAVAAVLGVVGLCEEKLAAMRHMPRRFAWAVTMVLSILWPLLWMLWVQPAAAVAPPVQEVVAERPAAATVAPAGMASQVLSSTEALPASAEPSKRWSLPLPSDRSLLAAWAAASGALLLHFLAVGLLLRRRASRWQRATVLGRNVLVSESTGPALLGVLRPQIVVPRWFLDEPAAMQSLILEHEQQHIAARDPLLLRAGLLVAVAVPWNLPLWWQLRRMRLAIELDCDARVLRTGAEAGSYGEVLLAVTQRAGGVPAGVIAMSEPVSALERRIRNLAADSRRHSMLRTVVAVLLAGAGYGVAATLEAPAIPRGAGDVAVRGDAPVLPRIPLPEPPVNVLSGGAVQALPASQSVPPPRVAAAGTVVAAAQATPPTAVAVTQTPAPPAARPGDGSVDLRNLIVLVGERFQKRFVVDPRVRASVDLAGFTPDSLTYHAFLEILGVHNFVAVPSGDVVTIIPDANVRTVASSIVGPDDIQGDAAEVVTVLIPIGSADIGNLVSMLRPLVAQWGYLSATADKKSLLLVDKVANARRIIALVQAQSKAE